QDVVRVRRAPVGGSGLGRRRGTRLGRRSHGAERQERERRGGARQEGGSHGATRIGGGGVGPARPEKRSGAADLPEQAVGDGGADELADVAAEDGDLLDQLRSDRLV